MVGFIGPVEYLLHHRGATHSVLLMPLWAFPLAWLLAKILREPGGWRALYGTCVMAIGAHIAGDWITGFGTMMLAPFSDWRAALGATFIIDLWFSGIIVAGLLLSALFFKSRIPSVVASIVLCSYVAFQYVQKEKAIEFGREYAQSKGIAGAVVTAHPRPVSPFNWTVFVSDEHTHRYTHVNVVREEPRRAGPGDGFVARLDAPYQPLAQAEWNTRRRYGEGDAARVAWLSPALAFYRWFAALPAYERTDADGCYWFADLRFLTPGRDWLPFQFGACREANGGPWRAWQRLDAGGKAPL